MAAIYKREMRMYFNSMIGYVFIAFFVLVTAIYFSMLNILSMSPEFETVFNSVIMMFLILAPILTMRLLSEETKQKTDQLLLTAPVNIVGIVMGKFLAAVTVFVIALAITAIFPVILSFYGTIAVAEIIGSYLGFFLLGSSFIAVGLFISSITDNQIVSAVATFAAVFVLLMVETIVSSASPRKKNCAICSLGMLSKKFRNVLPLEYLFDKGSFEIIKIFLFILDLSKKLKLYRNIVMRIFLFFLWWLFHIIFTKDFC